MKRDYLCFGDLSSKEIGSLLKRARLFKRAGKGVLRGKVLGLIFEKESTRTRISFQVAMHRLGGETLYIEAGRSQLSRGETYADTARVLSRYLDGIVLRTFSHQNAVEMARHATVPVINGLTDLHHPCQVLADLLTILEKKGDLSKLKIAYVGDGNNMANSWIEAACSLGLELQVATPPGFEPDAGVMKEASSVQIVYSKEAASAVKGVDVINTDTWFSMGQKVTEDKKAAFQPFQVNQKLLSLANPGALVLHCLPAHRGEEITDEVIDGPQSAVLDQAENRLYVQMALLELLMK